MEVLERDQREQEWSDLLDQSVRENTPQRGEGQSLAAMLGEYQPLADILGREVGHLYYRKPKLRQRIQIMRAYEGREDIEHASDYIEILCDMLSFCITRMENRQLVPVTGEELQDVLEDADEAKKLGTTILGMDFEKKGTPAEPTAENSSDG
jgi:hypothetical protein